MNVVAFADWVSSDAIAAGWDRAEVDALVNQLFEKEGVHLVRLARFFVDDTDAAEDLVQEAFIRLARSIHRIRDAEKATAYLRSIVLSLARDHNRVDWSRSDTQAGCGSRTRWDRTRNGRSARTSDG
jgi:DNA-directed RNA polymerase specialized sigma24 family protein